jgi:hypothetical protein
MNAARSVMAVRQLLYFYMLAAALKSVPLKPPLAPISHYQSYECKICSALCVTCVCVCVLKKHRPGPNILLCAQIFFHLWNKRRGGGSLNALRSALSRRADRPTLGPCNKDKEYKFLMLLQ